MKVKFQPDKQGFPGKDYLMLFATTAPALLVLALALGLMALSLMDGAPPAPAMVISTGGDN